VLAAIAFTGHAGITYITKPLITLHPIATPCLTTPGPVDRFWIEALSAVVTKFPSHTTRKIPIAISTPMLGKFHLDLRVCTKTATFTRIVRFALLDISSWDEENEELLAYQ